MKKREEIEEQYKWDLSSYIKDEKMLNEEFEYLKTNYPNFKKYNNKLSNKEMLLELFKFSDEFDQRLDRLACYIFHSLDQDKSNTYFLNLSKKLEFLSTEISQATAFISPQMLKLKTSYLKEVAQDVRFKDYKRSLEETIRDKKHRISEHDNILFSKMSMFLSSANDAYDNLTTGEIEFESFELDGEKFDVNEANYSKFMCNKNREVRKNALHSLMSGYGKVNRTLTSTYTNDILKDIFFAKISKFKSVKEEALFNEEVDKKVYDKLIDQINKHLYVLHEILEEKRKILKLEKIAYYDVMIPISEQKKYSIDKAIELIKVATRPLGEEYNQIMSKKFSSNCIDYLPNKNKETGAYSSGCYGCPSVILMNYVDDLRSVYTLAHEMGHTMHSELSNRTQPYATSQYKIFVAEVASTVNEMLLYQSLIKEADEKTKISLAFDLFDEFRSTVYRQTMFSEFESWIHDELENQKPKTYEDLNNFYFELNKKYFGDRVELPDELKFEWSRIPHFYRPFYVYKYSTGFISALCIVEKLLNEKDYYKKYINFLKAGSSKGVIDLLKDIDVDLTTNKPYEYAFKFLNEQLNMVKNFNKNK